MNHKATLSDAFPASAPSDGLRVRVSAIAARTAKRRRWRRIPALAFAVVAVIVLAVFLTPRAAKASTLSRIQSAFDNVKAFRIVSYLVDDNGNQTVSSILDSVDGKTREQRGKEIDFRQGNEIIVYRPDQKLAVKSTVVRNGRPMDDIRGLLMQLRRSNWAKNIQVDENAAYNGQPAIELSFESANEPSRIRMYADQKTLLPFRGEMDWKTPEGGWQLERIYEVSYDTGLDTANVTPNFPSDTRVIDNDQLKEEWRKRLERGLATIDKGGAHVVIRDVVGLSSGDVMVLYTNGRKHFSRKDLGIPHKASEVPPMPDLDALHDAAGHTYLPVDGMQGTMYTTKDDFVRGYVFNGEDLQTAWYTPLEESAPPREVKMHFMDMDASFDKMVEARIGGETPEWADFIGMAPRDATEVQADAAAARGQFYLGRDDQKAAEQLQKCIQLNDLRMAAIGEKILQGSTCGQLGSALHRLGRDSEARAALERAIRDDPSGRANYELLLKQLGTP